jgi:ribosomal protein S18 acetylase RimI-like enzyme
MHTDASFTFRPGTSDDAAALAELAARTFAETFAESNTPDDLALFLVTAYGRDQQLAELQDPSVTTLIVEQAGGGMIGFAQVREQTPPPSVTGTPSQELWRFYVAREWHGRGIAGALMDAVRADARNRQVTTLWLGVWERNARAIAFYSKCGFRRVGAKEFWVGTDCQTDDVMAGEA